jgi:hypothetical protein
MHDVAWLVSQGVHYPEIAGGAQASRRDRVACQRAADAAKPSRGFCFDPKQTLDNTSPLQA